MRVKKILCFFIILCITAGFTGCFNRIPGKIWKNPNLEGIYRFADVMIGKTGMEDWNENKVLTRVTWQKLRLSDYHSSVYPELAAAFYQYNEKSSTEAKALMYEFSSITQEMEWNEFNPAHCEAEAKLYLQRADESVVSLLESVYSYSGGVHPNYYVNGINYNTKTGKKTALSEVIKDTKKLPSVLSKKITEKYADVTFFNLEDTFSKYREEDFTWTIDYQGITFWFSPYEIAAYAVGTLSARLWFDEFPDMFNEEYKNTPENYVVTLPTGHEIDFDLLEPDGKKDKIYIEKTADDYGSYYMLSVTVNGKTYTDEMSYAYDYDVYLAHIGGKNYIYSDAVSDNDYHIFATWDINGETPEITDELQGTEVDCEFIEEGFEEGTVYRQCFNNPESIKLETRFNILGTRGATAYYRLNETDGKPEMTDKAYTFNEGHDVVTSVPLKAEILPKMEETELPSGTSLTPHQTDGKTFVDLTREDGEVVRLLIEVSDWPRKVNGMPEDECFEELFYAG
ncbi:MAG: DUF3298 domain-containing protein [Clostridia bacterium]|nr:DUF3298 domain-containing protein [Clostridia bacterium]